MEVVIRIQDNVLGYREVGVQIGTEPKDPKTFNNLLTEMLEKASAEAYNQARRQE